LLDLFAKQFIGSVKIAPLVREMKKDMKKNEIVAYELLVAGLK
jgi:hypothetical protein